MFIHLQYCSYLVMLKVKVKLILKFLNLSSLTHCFHKKYMIISIFPECELVYTSYSTSYPGFMVMQTCTCTLLSYQPFVSYQKGSLLLKSAKFHITTVTLFILPFKMIWATIGDHNIGVSGMSY